MVGSEGEVAPQSLVMPEEAFGPAAAIRRFAGLDELIAAANASRKRIPSGSQDRNRVLPSQRARGVLTPDQGAVSGVSSSWLCSTADGQSDKTRPIAQGAPFVPRPGRRRPDTPRRAAACARRDAIAHKTGRRR